MPEHDLVPEGSTIEPAPSWIQRVLGVQVGDPQQVDVLYFERFGQEPSGIVVLPDSFAGQLPRPTRTIARSQNPKSEDSLDYHPPKRVPRSDGAPGERSLTIEHISCREVSLRLSTARVSSWGINLDLLKRAPDANIEVSSFFQLLELNGLPAGDISAEAAALLHASFAVALTEKLDRDRTFKAPRMPVIHNQRCGLRYRLYFEREKMGSPSDIHVLLYAGDRRPHLYGVPAVERNTAAEWKQGLGLLRSPDQRIRFYQLTDSQWGEWSQARPDSAVFAPQIRSLLDDAFAAAEAFRKSIRA